LARAFQSLTFFGSLLRIMDCPETDACFRTHHAARACLPHYAKVPLADEPVGNLDSTHWRDDFVFLREQPGSGMTIVIVTHEPSLSEKFADRLGIVGHEKPPFTSSAKGLAQ
jgi:predicted ABC-type transport system involved in lysophospholipase L1 biosynthesis ATPase subunit